MPAAVPLFGPPGQNNKLESIGRLRWTRRRCSVLHWGNSLRTTTITFDRISRRNKRKAGGYSLRHKSPAGPATSSVAGFKQQHQMSCWFTGRGLIDAEALREIPFNANAESAEAGAFAHPAYK